MVKSGQRLLIRQSRKERGEREQRDTQIERGGGFWLKRIKAPRGLSHSLPLLGLQNVLDSKKTRRRMPTMHQMTIVQPWGSIRSFSMNGIRPLVSDSSQRDASTGSCRKPRRKGEERWGMGRNRLSARINTKHSNPGPGRKHFGRRAEIRASFCLVF